VVCPLINFCKGDGNGAAFQGILMFVRGVEQ
jgi:hypothetical protein